MPNIFEDIGLGIALLGLLLITIQGGRGGKDEDARKDEKKM